MTKMQIISNKKQRDFIIINLIKTALGNVVMKLWRSVFAIEMIYIMSCIRFVQLIQRNIAFNIKDQMMSALEMYIVLAENALKTHAVVVSQFMREDP